MHNKSYKKVIVFALVLTMLMPLGSMVASSTDDEPATDAVGTTDDTANDDSAADENADEDKDSKDDEEEIELITDEQAVALETCVIAKETDNFILYADEENDRICFYIKKTDKYWWSSPINVMGDQTIVDSSKGKTMKKAQREQVASSLRITYADLIQSKRNESTVYSVDSNATWTITDKGITISYKFGKGDGGFRIPVHYELEDDNLYAYVDTAEIEEADTNTLNGKILTKIEIAPYFGAQSATDIDGNPIEGYMIVPDGSGAVIEYNNGKSNYPTYSQYVYGRDYTAVPLSAPRVTEQAYLPVAATVSGDSGLVVVATDGESNCNVNAQITGQNKQAYNAIGFQFITRSNDVFFMSGDTSNRLTVYEKGDIKTERFGVRYYTVHADDDSDVNYADVASVYRNYLINEKGLTQKTEANQSSLYVDFYGGVLKQTSIIGIPFDLKTEITGFSQAQEIISKLNAGNVTDIVASYNDWTNKSITNNISTEAKASGTLGGTSDFEALMSDDNATIYPTMNNSQMDSSSWGYMTLTSTAIRISNAYSRQSSYSYAFGIAESGVAPALLSPTKYSQVFDEMIESYQDKNLTTIGFGDYSSKLVSDYSTKNTSSRDETMNTVISGYENAQNSVGSVIANEANSYVIPYASHITNVPISSSGFNITDYDIPFYQMVIHGYVPYSTQSINASSNSDETFLLALASGSSIHYDMVYEDASTLKDTDYDDLYYANYEGWLDEAIAEYSITTQVISGVSDMTISNYEVSDDGNVITTTYSKDGASDVVIVVNKSAKTATVDGKTIDIASALSEGGAED